MISLLALESVSGCGVDSGNNSVSANSMERKLRSVRVSGTWESVEGRCAVTTHCVEEHEIMDST